MFLDIIKTTGDEGSVIVETQQDVIDLAQKLRNAGL